MGGGGAEGGASHAARGLGAGGGATQAGRGSGDGRRGYTGRQGV